MQSDYECNCDCNRFHDIPKQGYHIICSKLARSSDGCRGVNYGGVKNILDAVKGRTDFFVYVTGTGIYGKTNYPITSETKPNPHTKNTPKCKFKGITVYTAVK